MSRSVAATVDQRPHNVGNLPLIGAVPKGQRTVNAVDTTAGQWLLDGLHAAIESTYSFKAAALDMGKDKGQLSRELAGDGHLSVARVGCLQSPLTLVAWAESIRSRFGVDDKAARIERAMQLIEQGRVMLAAEVAR